MSEVHSSTDFSTGGDLPVDNRLLCEHGSAHVSAPVETMDGKDTTSESAPEQRSWSSARGPRRPKGHDRLMDKVPPTPDESPAVCPTCGCTPTARSTRTSSGVTIGDYRCREGHIWSTHWMAVGA